MQFTVADFIVRQLIEWGIDTAFGLPGDSIFPFLEAIGRNDKIKFFCVRNEAAAGYMASGYGKIMGKPALCIADAGPGSVNLLNGLFDATNDGIPLIAITGQVPRERLFTTYIQSSNQNAVFSEAAAYTATLTVPEQTGRILEILVKKALSENKAVHLSVPEDLQKMKFTGRILPGPVISKASPKVDFSLIKKACELISRARRPVILAGYGTKGMGKEIAAFAEKIGAGIIVTSIAKGAVSEYHPHVVGVLGEAGNEIAFRIIQEADLVLIAGSTWWPEKFVPPAAKVIQIDINAQHLGAGKRIDLAVMGDLKEIIPVMEQELTVKADDKWVEEIKNANKQRESFINSFEAENDFPIHPARIMLALERVVPENAVITVDTGNHTLWFASNFRASNQDIILSGMWRIMGFALPAALGIKTAQPQRPVIALCGDGGLMQLLGELATAAQYQLPVLIIVVKNAAWALEGYKQLLKGYNLTGIKFLDVDFAGIAKAMGIKAVTIKKAEELEPLLSEGIHANEPILIEVPTAAVPAPELSRLMGTVNTFKSKNLKPTFISI